MGAMRTPFLKTALGLLDEPYIYGGKEPGRREDRYSVDHPQGLDCSGLVTWCYLQAGGPDWRGYHNAQKLFDELKPADGMLTEPATLVFYGADDHHVDHVMVVLGVCGLLIGASGGHHTTTTRAIAHANGAFVKLRESAHYRNDVRGYRELPFFD